MPGSTLKAMPGSQGQVVAGDQVRILVPLEPDPVPGPMEEGLAVALGVDPGARGGVDGRTGDPGSSGAGGRLLGAVEDREQVAESLVRALVRVAAGHPQRPGDVRAVAAQRAADVEHDRLTRLDDALGGLVVRRCRVRAGAHDREVRLLVAFGDESLADLPGHVGLRPSDQPPARDLADHAVGGLRGQAQERDLVGVLDHAQLAQDRRGRVVGRPSW